MSEQELYELSEPELRQMLANGERNVEREISRMYDKLAFTVVMLPFIDSFIKKGMIRKLDAIEKMQISNKIKTDLLNKLYLLLQSGIKQSWVIGEALSYSLLKKIVPEEILKHRFTKAASPHIMEYLNRKTFGLNLSQRVWNLSNGMIDQIEATLQLGILEGKSANSISGDLKQYLKEPDRLYRRVRDRQGELRLSRNAANYHPGQGVHRSSFKNARRLAATEINKTYRNAQWETWQNLDFVVGQEIRRSNHVYDCDVCESLKGRYPKDFKFSGWHPHCRCHAIPIMATEKELLDSINDDSPVRSKNEIKSFPGNFHKWVEDNKQRYKPNTNDWIDENPIVKKMFYN
jgi:hypothetical protein